MTASPFKPDQCFKAITSSESRPPMLECRFLNGNSLSFAYAYLVWAGFNPSEGITLTFTSHTVRVRGRNLGELHRALLSQAVAWVASWDELHNPVPADATEVVVTAITVLDEEGKVIAGDS